MENNPNLPEETSNAQPENQSHHQGNRAGLASRINSIISSPTSAVRSRHAHSSSAANTGTNVSYEGATAPGSGGAVGTGDASGQSATGQRITTDSDYHTAGESYKTTSGTSDSGTVDSSTEHLIQKDHDDALDRSTTGTP